VPTPSPAPPKPGSPAALWIEAQQTVHGDSAAARYTRLANRFGRQTMGEAAVFELADYLYARGDYAAARSAYARVHGPQARHARLGEALCLFALGDPARARMVARGQIKRHDDPITWLASLLVAQCYENEGRLPEAFAAYRRLLDLPAGPAQPAALLGAARLAERSGEHKEARENIDRLRSRYPNSPETAESRDLLRSAAPKPGESGAASESEGDGSASP
jgi:TolA-binding protein